MEYIKKKHHFLLLFIFVVSYFSLIFHVPLSFKIVIIIIIIKLMIIKCFFHNSLFTHFTQFVQLNKNAPCPQCTLSKNEWALIYDAWRGVFLTCFIAFFSRTNCSILTLKPFEINSRMVFPILIFGENIKK